MHQPDVVQVGFVLGVQSGQKLRCLEPEEPLTLADLLSETDEHDHGEQTEEEVSPCSSAEQRILECG
jgi:hypothetical protein